MSKVDQAVGAFSEMTSEERTELLTRLLCKPGVPLYGTAFAVVYNTVQRWATR